MGIQTSQYWAFQNAGKRAAPSTRKKSWMRSTAPNKARFAQLRLVATHHRTSVDCRRERDGPDGRTARLVDEREGERESERILGEGELPEERCVVNLIRNRLGRSRRDGHDHQLNRGRAARRRDGDIVLSGSGQGQGGTRRRRIRCVRDGWRGREACDDVEGLDIRSRRRRQGEIEIRPDRVLKAEFRRVRAGAFCLCEQGVQGRDTRADADARVFGVGHANLPSTLAAGRRDGNRGARQGWDPEDADGDNHEHDEASSGTGDYPARSGSDLRERLDDDEDSDDEERYRNPSDD